MKITFKQKTKNTKISTEYFYVVMCKFIGGQWSVASFFGLPFSAARYLKAVKLKRAIFQNSSSAWKEKHFTVAKITF